MRPSASRRLVCWFESGAKLLTTTRILLCDATTRLHLPVGHRAAGLKWRQTFLWAPPRGPPQPTGRHGGPLRSPERTLFTPCSHPLHTSRPGDLLALRPVAPNYSTTILDYFTHLSSQHGQSSSLSLDQVACLRCGRWRHGSPGAAEGAATYWTPSMERATVLLL